MADPLQDYEQVSIYGLNPDDQDFLEIYRREDLGIDDDAHDGGEYTFLSDQVVAFDIEVYPEDGPDVDPKKEWDAENPESDSSSEDEPSSLPAALKLSLTVELKPRIDRESLDTAAIRKRRVTFVRWIRLPEVLRYADGQYPRIAIPPTPAGSGSEPDPSAGGVDPNATSPDDPPVIGSGPPPRDPPKTRGDGDEKRDR